MNDATLLSARVAKINADSEDCADFRGVKAQQFVGAHAEPMTDEEIRQAEYRAGAAMVAWHDRYEKTGDPACWRIAFRHMQQMFAIRAMGRRIA